MLNISPDQIPHAIAIWGYPVMFLLMFFEGPIATITSAFLASMGLFNVFIVFILSVLGDILGDIGLYYIGYFGGMRLIKKIEKTLQIKEKTVEKLKKKFHENSARIIFYVKSTTGLSYITFTLAGALKMKFSRFIKSSILGGLVWSSFLVIMGYFFGYAAVKIDKYIKFAGIFTFILVILMIVAIAIYKKRQARELIS